MVDVSVLKLFGEIFYLVVALCALYGLWKLFREYRAINSTVIKTHITAYELRRLVERRVRQS
jgi:uncharacterized membrane protein YuzA (DUF378 family)